MVFGEGNNREEEYEAMYELLDDLPLLCAGRSRNNGESNGHPVTEVVVNNANPAENGLASGVVRVAGQHRVFPLRVIGAETDETDETSETAVNMATGNVGRDSVDVRGVSIDRETSDLEDAEERNAQGSPGNTTVGDGSATTTNTEERSPGNNNSDVQSSLNPTTQLVQDYEVPLTLVEDVLDGDEEMQNYTKSIEESCTNSVMYGGSASDIDPGVATFLQQLDEAFWPVREDNFFREGKRKARKTKHVLLHHPNMLSHSYLQTHPEGVLHILPGWTGKAFIKDVSYRFYSKYKHLGCQIPFLGGLRCTVRTYHCAGVLVCKNCSEDYRHNEHTVVNPRDKSILDSIDALSPLAEARKKVVGIFLGLEAKKKSKRGFCPHRSYDPDGRVVKCCGQPKVIPSVYKPGTYFVGCSGYTPEERRNGSESGERNGNRHYASSLNLEEAMRLYLERLLSGEERPSVENGSSCNYVRGKNQGKTLCPIHGCELVNIPCKRYHNDKHPSHTMCTFEPEGYHEDTPLEMKVLYVSCIGEHCHPPPPPPDTTVMKMRIFEQLCGTKRWSSLAQLRNMVQTALLKLKEKGNDGDEVRLFEGSLKLSRSSLRRRLRLLRPPVSRLAVEVGELGLMAGDQEMPYVRELRIVGGKYLFFLGRDDLLLFASRRMAFAGDATFKTVTEANRAISDGRWYLYNIVVYASADRLNGSSIVVMRVLTTGLSKDVYRTIWTYFFKSLVRASNMVRGEESLDHGCIQVPYIDLAPALRENACPVTSIMMDFDAAEIHGCAEALQEMCGGTLEMHLSGMFVGCSVQLDRDLVRRSREEKLLVNGLGSRDLVKMYNEFRRAQSPEEARTALQKIKGNDPEWVKWVQTNGLAPLISKALSRMKPEIRSLAFSDTNVVESQNRRGNVLIGTHLRPGEAARRLYELDTVDATNLVSGVYNEISTARGYRNRSDSILRPSGPVVCGKRKRSRKGRGPTQTKGRKRFNLSRSVPTSKGAASASMGAKVTENEREPPTENDDMRVSVHAGDPRISICVQKELSKLLTELESLPPIETPISTDGCDEDIHEKRMCIVIDIIGAVNDSRGCVEKIKTVLIDAMRSEAVKKDRHLQKAIVAVYHVCMQPPVVTCPSKGDDLCGTVSTVASDGCENDARTGGRAEHEVIRGLGE